MAEQIRNIIAGGERTERDVFFQAAGDILERVTLVHRHGIAYEIPSSAKQTIWEYDFDYPRILTAAPISIVSDSLEDNPAGLGARKILISGCDINGDPQWEIFEPDGLTPKETTKSFFWMDFAHVVQAGEPYGGALGTISFTHTGSVVAPDPPQVGLILPGVSRTAQAIAVIPNEYSGYILNAEIACPNAQNIIAGFRVSGWPDDSGNSVQQIAFQHMVAGGGPWQIVGRASERIHYPALVEMVAIATQGMDLQVSGSFSMLAVHDDYDFSIPDELFGLPDVELATQLRLRPGMATAPGSFNWPEPD